MNTQPFKRKLAAILSADVKGYSRLMGEDEDSTVRTLKDYREVMTECIQRHRGRVVDSPGDNLMAEFASVVDGVQSAVEIQEELKTRNAELPENRRMQFRIGINLGDVIEEEGSIYGDGVNIAARMESMADAGGICISGTAYDQVKNKLALGYEYLGKQSVKNIPDRVRVYRLITEPEAAGSLFHRDKRDDPRHGRKVYLAIITILILGAVAGAIWHYYFRTASPPAEVASKEKTALPLPDKPSIAVLPFNNMSDDPKQEYFSDGMTEDIITDLSKVSGLFVIARNTTFTYKGKAVKVEQISRELGVRYVLEGSVRKAGNRVRITAQLVDGTTGGHVWAERYDRDLKDVFDLQDEVTQRIVAALAVKLTTDELERVVHKETENLVAYDYLLRGQEYFSHKTKETNTKAQEMFQKAIDLDPEYALAYAWLAKTRLMEWVLGWSEDPHLIESAFELAQKAIALDDSAASGHSILGDVYLWKKQHEKAVAELEKAIALDPNSAESYGGFGYVLSWAGRPEDAVPLIKKAIRLDPKHSAWYYWSLGHSYFLTARYGEATGSFKESLNRGPDFWPSHIFLAASYIKLGREDEARPEAAKALKMNPKLSLEAWRQKLPYKDPAVLESVLEAFRQAGLK